MESLLLCGESSSRSSTLASSTKAKMKLNNNNNNNNNNTSNENNKKKKKKIVKCVSYLDPNLVVKSDTEILRFQIHYFELLQHKHGQSFFTPTIKAFDNYWRLQFWPNGSNTGPPGYIACGLCLCEDNSNTISTSSQDNVDFDDNATTIPAAGSFGSIGSIGSTGSSSFRPSTSNNKKQSPKDNKQPPKAVWTFQIQNLISKEFTRVFTKPNQPYGENKLIERSVAINNYLDGEGTFTIDVNLQVYIKKQRTWYPKVIMKTNPAVHDHVDGYDEDGEKTTPPPPPGKQYLESNVGTDITFVVGQEKERICSHKCILFQRSMGLYELVADLVVSGNEFDNRGNDQEQQQQKQDKNNNNNIHSEIDIPDIDVSTFKLLLEYIYTGQLPTFLNTEIIEDGTSEDETDVGIISDAGKMQQQQQQQQAKELLNVSNRFGCSELKLYVESVVTDKLVTPDTAADWLLLSDSYICPLLKEECMKIYIENPLAVMSSTEAWNKVSESNTLLHELLHFGTIAIKSSSQNSYDYNNMSVRALREKLESFNLNLDGTKAMLIQRLQNYHNDIEDLLFSKATTSCTNQTAGEDAATSTFKQVTSDELL